MEYVKKKIFFVNLQKILEKKKFVLFFQYTHLKNKDWTKFKFNLLQKNLNLNTNLNINKHKNIYICNNKILCKYFEKNLCLKKLNYNIEKLNLTFLTQGPTVCIFFDDKNILQFFFNEILKFKFQKQKKIENKDNFQKYYVNNLNFIEKKNSIFLQKKVSIPQNLFFIGGIYEKSFVNINTLKKICLLNNNIYNIFYILYFRNIYFFSTIVYKVKIQCMFSLILIFYKLHACLYKIHFKNNLSV